MYLKVRSFACRFFTMAPKKDNSKKNEEDKKDARPGSANDPIFSPTASVDLDELTEALSSLTLEEQLVVAKSYKARRQAGQQVSRPGGKQASIAD